MSKYEILTTWRLRQFIADNPNIYTPGGNKPFVVNDGLLGGQVMYDPKTKKVYGLCMKEIKVEQSSIDYCEGVLNKQKVSDAISFEEAKEWLAKRKDK